MLKAIQCQFSAAAAVFVLAAAGLPLSAQAQDAAGPATLRLAQATPETPPPATTTPPAPSTRTDTPESSRAREDRRDDRREGRRGDREERDADRRHPEWRRAMGPFALAALCNPRLSRFAQMYSERAEEAIKPTEAQRSSFNALKDALNKAAEGARTGCDGEVSATAVGRIDMVERRLDGVLQAVRGLRGPLESFYRSLDEEQKARFNAMFAQADTRMGRGERSERRDRRERRERRRRGRGRDDD